MRLVILTCLCFVIISSNIIACDCGYGGPFLKMATRTKLVSLVKVKRFLTFRNINGSSTPMSMEVEIIDVYQGKEDRKTVTVWGDPGWLCRPYLLYFKEGSYYVIAFGTAGYVDNAEKATDYSISICGTFWLTVDNKKETVTGEIGGREGEVSSMSLKKLKSAIQSPSK